MALTTKQRKIGPNIVYRFAALIAEGQDVAVAAKAAGENDPEQLQSHPDFTGALIASLYHNLATRHAPKALKTLAGLLDSRDEKVQLQASKAIIGYALPDVKPGDGESDGDLESMPTSKLQALVGKLESELADRAKPVNASNGAPIDVKALDFMQ